MKSINPLLIHAREISRLAALQGHVLVWRNLPCGGFGARCTDERCRINMTVTDDGKPGKLTIERPIPKCPLNTQSK